jgi:outer membrane receptor for ferrienterochelin and colicin
MSDQRNQCSRGIPSFARKLMLVVSIVACVTLAMPATMHAQVTTGNIAGTVSDPSSGPLPGVSVEAVHVPTGTRYSAISDSHGRYTFPNVRVGGPYHVTATLEGMKPADVNNIQVSLGSTTEVPLNMRLSAVSESITVTARPDDVINPNHVGSTSTVAEKQIESLPTINRSLQDFARTNPYFVVDPSDPSASTMQVAGRNNRYNNIQIDGAVNNDLFGLASTGTPGGQSNAQPISLDAIEQIQLVVSPYDVRQGGFTGGGVNVVTRSGSNKFAGSLYGTKRDQSSVGKAVPVFQNTAGQVGCCFNGNGTITAVTDKPITQFNYSQYGGRIGGPIMQDKLFFFLNGERNRRDQPDGTSAITGNLDGSAGTNYANATQDVLCNPTNLPALTGCSAARLRQDLITKYGYDPGSLGDLQKATPSDLLFGRLDFNATAGNALTLRHNYVKAGNDIVSNRSGSQFRFPTSIYTQANKTNSSVAQLNSVLTTGTFNEARVGVQTIKDIRSTPIQFPSIEIGGANQNATLNAGTERFSAANSLDQKITEITDDFTVLKGNHTIVLGTHNELFKFKNLFMSEANGYYFYPTLAAFENQTCPKITTGTGCEYRISYATGSDPRRPTAFGAEQFGLYINDQWHASNNTSFTFGLRADKPRFNDTPSFNQTVMNAIGFNTATHPAEELVWSPRVGFNWNPGGSTKQQVRGGVGVFAGRAPYVWVSNAYAGTGVEQVALACRAIDGCVVPAFIADPANQPKLGAAGALSVDLIDPNFHFPRVVRSTLGYDRDLFFGIRGTAEVVYSKTQSDIYYTNLNETQTGISPLDGRPTYSRRTGSLVDATFLTNTGKGAESVETIQLSKAPWHGVSLSGNYAHQHATSAFDATSSRAISNWRFQHSQGNIFQPTLGTSAFQQKHRLNLNATYDFATGPFSHTFGLYYNAQSGRPYSLLLGGDPNKDTNASNDLLYVPGNNVILCPSNGGTPSAANPCGTRTVGGVANTPVAPLAGSVLQNYLSFAGIDPSKPRILNKYESTEPWSRHLDFHYALGLPLHFARTEVTFDMLNLMHYFDKNQGNVYFVSNQNVTPVNYVSQQPGSNIPVYREGNTTFSDANGTVRQFGTLTPGRQFSISDLQSRWQMRLGLRLTY